MDSDHHPILLHGHNAWPRDVDLDLTYLCISSCKTTQSHKSSFDFKTSLSLTLNANQQFSLCSTQIAGCLTRYLLAHGW